MKWIVFRESQSPYFMKFSGHVLADNSLSPQSSKGRIDQHDYDDR